MSSGRVIIAGGLAVLAATVVGCAAAGNVDPSGAGGGAAGSAGSSSGSAGVSGGAGTSPGTAGSSCVAPAVANVAWTIGADATSPEITCDQAGAATVQLLMNSIRTEFTCSAKMGTTSGLAVGMTTPRVLLVGSQGTVLAQGPLSAVTIPSCGVVNLGRLRFVVTPTGAGGTGGGAGGTSGAGGTGGGAGGASGTAGTGGGTGPCDAMPIFAVHSCAAAMACHDANGAAASFNMKTTGWEKMLVGVQPGTNSLKNAPGLGSVCAQSGMPYLVAGSSPARGLFLDKLMSARPACGAQMPLIPPNLSATELDCVQRWANGLTKPN
jgi:hypothetical protein